MRDGWRSLVPCLLLFVMTTAVAAEEQQTVDFEHEILPLLEERCLQCHSSNIRKGELSLSTAADLMESGYVEPGNSTASYLVDMVTSQDGQSPSMPKNGTPLSDEQVELIKRWIDEGAIWPEGIVARERSKADKSWWAFQPLAGVEPPNPTGLPEAWQHNPIDRFVFAGLQERGLTPNPPADKVTLIRRATYDLTGLPPTPEEVAAFLADESPQAYEKLIDRLLASPHYGEHWGRHWLDVIRFGESRGYERNQIINNLWPLRDYVIGAINDDLPFSELYRQHLAGDVIAPENPDLQIASAFLVSGPYDDVGNQDPVQAAQIRANEIDEIISATCEAFLGLTVGCARCHDHKFDPILQRDYYALYATFAGIKHGEREVGTPQEQAARDAQLKPLLDQMAELKKQVDAIEARISARIQEQESSLIAQWKRPPVSRSGTVETFPPQKVKFVKLVGEGVEGNPSRATGFRLDEFEVWTAGENARNVALASAGGRAEGRSREIQDAEGAYSANLTIDGKFGTRWIASGPELMIILPQAEVVDRVVFSSDRFNSAGNSAVALTVIEYRILVSEDGQSWREVANSKDRQPYNDQHRQFKLRQDAMTPDERDALASLEKEQADLQQQINRVPKLPVLWVGLRQRANGPYHIFVGGSPQNKGDTVTSSSLSTLSEVTPAYQLDGGESEGERRLAFADWIVHPENPLTPRVLANRVWHYHFGTGIVSTPSDFGYMGGKPTHPELLDWLARTLQNNGWRLKPLHRQIMLSQTYRQSADFRDDAALVDGDSRYLWRFPPRRLTGEEIRDTILTICGKLNPSMGGPGFRLYQYYQDNVATYVPLDVHGPETYRRSVYHQNARAARIDLMSDFDLPDCAFPSPRRAETTTPLQALTMLNHQFTFDMAESLATRLTEEKGADAQEQIQRAYELCFQREPTDEERQTCQRFLSEFGLTELCRVWLNTSELIYVK